MQLVDSFGRIHTSLRISVTDRCNIRCFYCMPEHVQFLPRKEIMTFEEIVRTVKLFAELGINKIRLTGGEPLVRRDLPDLIKRLTSIGSIKEVALTTNGVLLADQADALKESGLNRLNVSLDSVSEETYREITRRSGLEKVLAGIDAAQLAGFEDIRINAVAIKNLTEPSIIPLAKYCTANRLHLRFIEFMPLDADNNWLNTAVLNGEDILKILELDFGTSSPMKRSDPSQPATDFEFSNGLKVGFINSVSQPFCSDCNRLRMTAEGKMRNCLFSTVDFDLRELLRSDASDMEIIQRMIDCVSKKKKGHGINSETFERPERAMYQIGG